MLIIRTRDQAKICNLNTVSAGIMVITNVMLGAWSGAILSAVVIVRAQLVKRNILTLKLLLTMMSISVTLSIMFMEAPKGWLAVVGSSISTISYFALQKSEKRYRSLRLLANIPGSAYYILSLNYVAFTAEMYGVFKNIQVLYNIHKDQSVYEKLIKNEEIIIWEEV